MTYNVTTYKGHDRDTQVSGLSAREAATLAYGHIGDNSARSASIWPTGSQHGLFSCRYSDLDSMSFDDLVRAIETKKYSRTILT